MLFFMQAFYFPIDPRLNFFVANKLLKELAVSERLSTALTWVLLIQCQNFYDFLKA